MPKITTPDTKQRLYKNEMFEAKCQAKITKGLSPTNRFKATYHPPQVSLPQWRDIFSSEAENTHTIGRTNRFAYQILLSMAILTTISNAAEGKKIMTACSKELFQRHPLSCCPPNTSPPEEEQCYTSELSYIFSASKRVSPPAVRLAVGSSVSCRYDLRQPAREILRRVNQCIKQPGHYASISSDTENAQDILDIQCADSDAVQEVGFSCNRYTEPSHPHKHCADSEEHTYQQFMLDVFGRGLQKEMDNHFSEETRDILHKLFVETPLDSAQKRLQGIDKNIHTKALLLGSEETLAALSDLKEKIPHIMRRQSGYQHIRHTLSCIDQVTEQTASIQHVMGLKTYDITEATDMIQNMIQNTIHSIHKLEDNIG